MLEPELRGLHHVTLPVSDLERSAEWYSRAFGAHHDPQLDHRDASGLRVALVLRVPGLASTVKLHLAQGDDSSVRGYDPLTFAVEDDSSLECWIAHLERVGVDHEPISRGRIGRVVRLSDPDGTPLRLYSLAGAASHAGFGYAAARKIVDEALLRSRTLDLPPMTIAVLDAGGHLCAFGREDGSSLYRERIARGKAHGALGMGVGSRSLEARAEKHPAFITAVAEVADGGLIPVPGGVLIRDASGAVVGSVGVSGAVPDDDEDCAVHAIAAAGMVADPGVDSRPETEKA
ncbi:MULTISPECIES: heme-binding protein [unclassified Microbacterium]|uniref:heme-binding protein n=1 Tax=unclassified Microbacterium TaxID=2609290 RepID=UPI0036491BDC